MANQVLVHLDGNVAGVWSDYILRKFIPGLKAEMIFADYAEPAMLPSREGGVVARWLLPTMRSGSTTALNDLTIATSANIITITNVETTIADYGEFMYISDLARETQVRPALDAYADIITYAGATAIDNLIRAELADNLTNYLHAGDTALAGVTLTSSDTLKAKDLPVVAGFLRSQNAKGWENLSKDFMLAIHPNVETDLVTDVTTAELSWSEVNKHVPAGFDQLINNHRFVGRLNGISILRTTQIGTLTENDAVAAYQCLAVARHAVGWLGLGKAGPKKPQIIFKSPGANSTNDPLNQQHTMGWKVRAAAKLLDDNRAMIVYSAV